MVKVRAFVAALAATAVIGGLGSVHAVDNTGAAPRVVPPPRPQELTKGRAIDEQGIKIIRRDGAEFQEYSAGGRVYAVKVIPSHGPSYWLYDFDGNGSLEMRGDFLNEMPPPMQWQILTW